jgi:FkbM family methyltransferase
MLNDHTIKVFLRTNRVTGPFVRWLWRHYLTAVTESCPDVCRRIPKVSEAGKIFTEDHAQLGLTQYQVMHNGLKIKLNSYYDNLYTQIISDRKGHHEMEEELIFYEVLQSLPDEICFIEVGAYWGYYSMWAQKAKKATRNILLEPNVDHLKVAQENFVLNGLQGEFLQAGISSLSEPRQDRVIEGNVVRDLEMISIDDLMTRFEVDFAHVIHADTEGAEFHLLKGSLQSMQNERIGYLFLSTHSRKLHAQCLEFLEQNDFLIIASLSTDEGFGANGILIARAKKYNGIGPIELPKYEKRQNAMIIATYIWKKIQSM